MTPSPPFCIILATRMDKDRSPCDLYSTSDPVKLMCWRTRLYISIKRQAFRYLYFLMSKEIWTDFSGKNGYSQLQLRHGTYRCARLWYTSKISFLFFGPQQNIGNYLHWDSAEGRTIRTWHPPVPSCRAVKLTSNKERNCQQNALRHWPHMPNLP